MVQKQTHTAKPTAHMQVTETRMDTKTWGDRNRNKTIKKSTTKD